MQIFEVKRRLKVLAVVTVVSFVGLGTAGPGAGAAETDFATWLEGVHKEGLERGISKATLDAALTGLRRIARVIKHDRHQPEFTMTLKKYLANVVPPSRVEKGKRKFSEHSDLLHQVGAKFGVQPRFIVALWGIESSFGRHRGGYSVVAALATLAHDGRRSSYFRKELFNALTILDQGHISVGAMKGSWAGAMGQSQFMPSSFLNFAVDFDGDGKRDIWDTEADVFASAANYLKRSGWRDDQTWGREVKLPQGFDAASLMPSKRPKGCRALKQLTVRKRLSEWQRMGVRRADGGALPGRDLAAALVLPDGPGGTAFLVYNNFRAALKWNCSILFATAVGLLADRIKGG
jgi:membrane-bound lytic murein transglycosylase B